MRKKGWAKVAPPPTFTVPPTAGLALRWADLPPWGSSDLAGALAQWLGVPQVWLTCSGTAALLWALAALRQVAPERTEVVLPAYTCPLVALAVAQSGLQVRLCDVRSDCLDLCPQALQRLCSARTLAVLPTHLGGRLADVAAALACAHAVGAYVVEDAAQALGAQVAGQPVGWQGDMGFYSLAVGKGLTTFEGGVLVARNPQLQQALRAVGRPRPAGLRGLRLACHDAAWELRRSAELLGYALLYRPAGLNLAYGRPLRSALAEGDWVQAAGDDFADALPRHPLGAWRRRVGRRGLQRLRGFQEQLAAQAQARLPLLAALPGVQVVGDAPGCAPGYALPGGASTMPAALGGMAFAGPSRGVWPLLLLRWPSASGRDALLQRHWGGGWGLSLPFVHTLAGYGRYQHVLSAALHDATPQADAWAQQLLAVSNSLWLDDGRFHHLLQILEREALAG